MKENNNKEGEPVSFTQERPDNGAVEEGGSAPASRFDEVRRRVQEEALQKHVKEKEEKKDTIIPPLRTYKDDVARSIRKNQESFVSVLAAESKRRARQAQEYASSEKTRSSQFILVASAILILAGVGSLVLFFLLREEEESIPLTIPAHIFTEEQKEVDITGESRTAIMRTLIDEGKQVDLPLGSLAQLYPTETLLGEERIISPRTFLSRLEVRASNQFLRTVGNTMTLGVHIANNTQPFLIVDVTSFDVAFAGMLEWEDDMHEDLAPLFGSPSRAGEEGIVFSVASPFTDKVVRNRDARVLQDARGDIVFLYSFLDKETLVITTNETTFNEVVTRFVSSRI